MAEETKSAAPRGDGALWLLVCAALAVWAWHAVPILLGEQALFYRDLAHNHFALRWVGAQALAHGEIPAFVEQLGNGLPYRGNPAAVPFYPGNLLYLLAPFWSAFGGHIVLHWLLAGFTMYALGRVLGMSRWAAATAGITYAGGGWLASAMTFYNIVAVVAWWPAVIAAGVLGGRFGIAAGGLACGLALLGGEPLTALLGLPPLVLAVAGRHGLKKGLGTCLAIGSIGVLIALPQIVATASVLGYSTRGFMGVQSEQMAQYAFQWSRLFELLLPFPFGHPGYLGPHGWWLLGRLPFYFCLYSGVAGLALAFLSGRRADRATTSRPWAMLGVLGLLLAWAGGVQGELVVRLTAGLFRYPEKFLFWFALALPLLVGFGLDELRRRAAAFAGSASARYRMALWAGFFLVAAAPVVLVATPSVLAFLSAGKAETALSFQTEWALEVQAQMLSAQLAMAGVLLAAFALLSARGWWRAVALLQVLCLLPVGTLVLTVPVSAYREAKPWFAHLPAGSGVVDSRSLRPPWGFGHFLTVNEDFSALYPIEAGIAGAVSALPLGFRLPFKGDSEGMGQATYSLLQNAGAVLPWAERANWLAVVGTDALVSVEPARVPSLEAIERRLFAGLPLHWLRVRHPLPFAFSPTEVLPDPSPYETLRRVGRLADPIHTVITQEAFPDHRPGTKVSVLERGDDRVVLEVDGPGGLVVVRRLFHPLWEASSGGKALRTSVAQLILMGVEVPPGRHRVVLEVPAGRDRFALGLAIVVASGCLVLAWCFRRDLRGVNQDPESTP